MFLLSTRIFSLMSTILLDIGVAPPVTKSRCIFCAAIYFLAASPSFGGLVLSWDVVQVAMVLLCCVAKSCGIGTTEREMSFQLSVRGFCKPNPISGYFLMNQQNYTKPTQTTQTHISLGTRLRSATLE
jgi:hypothetical protein